MSRERLAQASGSWRLSSPRSGVTSSRPGGAGFLSHRLPHPGLEAPVP